MKMSGRLVNITFRVVFFFSDKNQFFGSSNRSKSTSEFILLGSKGKTIKH